jgi:hypothetical protein
MSSALNTLEKSLFMDFWIVFYVIHALWQDPSPSYSNRAAARCVLLHEFCPALHAILEDGLKVYVFPPLSSLAFSLCFLTTYFSRKLEFILVKLSRRR